MNGIRLSQRRLPRVGSRAGIAGLTAALMLSSCTTTVVYQATMRIATGSKVAVYYAFGQSLARILDRELPEVSASVMVTAASVENVALISAGNAELGFTQADVLPANPPYGIAAVARVYDDLLHLVTRADGPIRRLEDLRGRRVSIGAPGSGTEITANRLLSVSGLSDGLVQRYRLGLDASVEALRAGTVDAFFFSGGLPVKAVDGFAAQTPARLVDLGQWVEPLRQTYSEVYIGRDIPTSVYRLAPVTTVAVPNYLVVARALPDHLVYELTRLLLEKRYELSGAHPAAARLNAQSAIFTLPLPLHAGAVRYYRSSKP